MKSPIVITFVKPGDSRGWIGLGCYLLVIFILLMIWVDRSLLKDDFFKVIATAIILNGWNNGPVGWAYQATKGGGELADANAAALKQRAATDAGAASDDPQPVTVVNPPTKPVPTKSTKETKS